MGLSARTSDLTGAQLPEGYIKLATSAGNAIYVSNPQEADLYRAQNAAQFSQPNNNGGDFTDTVPLP